MRRKTQEINQEPQSENGVILLQGMTYTLDETKTLIRKLQKLVKNCNVATTMQPMVQSLFESVNDPDALTIYINTDEEFNDIRVALKAKKDSLLAIIDSIMTYYSDKESLNIIVKKHVLRNHGDSYFRYTAQFTQQIAAKTQEFLKIKVIYDSEKELLGIFCRKSDFEISVTFFGQLLYTLLDKRDVFAPFDSMPDTYQDFPSMLFFKLRKKVSEEGVEVKMQKQKTGLRFFLEKPKNPIDKLALVV